VAVKNRKFPVPSLHPCKVAGDRSLHLCKDAPPQAACARSSGLATNLLEQAICHRREKISPMPGTGVFPLPLNLQILA
jgi:hypothetical protein